jgi:hypothetical protein
VQISTDGKLTGMDGDPLKPDSSHAADDELIASISPDVMACLTGQRFFEELDQRLCPNEKSDAGEACAGNYAISESILKTLGFDATAITEIFAVLGARGGFCDCEILYSAVEHSRLKAEYWQAKAEGKQPRISHSLNP